MNNTNETSTDLELRILSSLHQGASHPINDGASIGSDINNDLVLFDQGITGHLANIKLLEHGWQLLTPDEDQTDTTHKNQTYKYNHPVEIQQLWLTITSKDSPWIKPVTQPLSEPAATTTAAAVRPPESLNHRQDNWLIKTGLTVFTVSVIAVIFLAWILIPSDTTAVATSKTTQQLVPYTSEQVQSIIDQLGLGTSISTRLNSNNMVEVQGWLNNNAEYEILATAMTQVWPMPAIKVGVIDEAIQNIIVLLKNFDYAFVPVYDGNGRISIRGIATDNDTKNSVLQAIKSQLPNLVVNGHNILLADEVLNKLAVTLGEAGIKGVSISWHNHRLAVNDTGMEDIDIDKLQATIDSFNQHFFDIASLAFDASSRKYATSVPFPIKSVISGKAAFLVLADGRKLLIGGKHNTYRLTAIEDKRIIFEGPRPAIILR